MADSNIEWTDKVWNPVTGCDKVSQGCKNCYAEGVADRFFAKQYPPNADGSPRKFTDVRTHEDRLEYPLRWRKAVRVFVNSMSDLFHEDVPFDFIDDVFGVMQLCPQHTFQVLTKRPERMLAYLSTPDRIEAISDAIYDHGLVENGVLGDDAVCRGMDRIMVTSPSGEPMFNCEFPLPNVWLGTSVEDQQRADERIPLLLQTPAAVRWISAEPLLGPILLAERDQPEVNVNWLRGFDGSEPAVPHLNWVVVGGESGPGARRCDIAWIESIVDQCRSASVACFVKQIGSKPFDSSPIAISDRKGGDPSEWTQAINVRQYPAVHA